MKAFFWSTYDSLMYFRFHDEKIVQNIVDRVLMLVAGEVCIS